MIFDDKSFLTRGTLWNSAEFKPLVRVLRVAPDSGGVSWRVPAVVVVADIREGVAVGGGGRPPLARESTQGGAAGTQVVLAGGGAILAVKWQVLGGLTSASVKEQKHAQIERLHAGIMPTIFLAFYWAETQNVAFFYKLLVDKYEPLLEKQQCIKC